LPELPRLPKRKIGLFTGAFAVALLVGTCDAKTLRQHKKGRKIEGQIIAYRSMDKDIPDFVLRRKPGNFPVCRGKARGGKSSSYDQAGLRALWVFRHFDRPVERDSDFGGTSSKGQELRSNLPSFP
jgi:hypothetical protein